MGKECCTFPSREELEAGADNSPEVLDGACGGLAQDRLEFGKELFDWIEIRTIGRKVDEGCNAGLNCLADTRNLVNANIVHDDDITTFEGWGEYLFDIGFEARASHWSIQQQRRGDTIMAQGGNEGRSFPVAVWHLADEPFTAFSPTVAAGHVR